jgi:hypothetical protein
MSRATEVRISIYPCYWSVPDLRDLVLVTLPLALRLLKRIHAPLAFNYESILFLLKLSF